MVEDTHELLAMLGINSRRLRLKWISASEGAAFAEEIRDFAQEIASLDEIIPSLEKTG